MLQNIQFVAGQGGLEAIGETHEELFTFDRRRACHDPHGAARMDERVVRSAHLDNCHDLRSGKNVIRLVRHWFDPNN